jgi:demethylmenaquinone methyltransferase/2-methoxy-6-polyprenyl-1,4-benzoquinol methylase
MIDTNEYINQMLVSQPLLEPTILSAIRTLQLPPGSHGLDAGCGIGLQAMLLANAIKPDGHVTGLDIAPEFLSYGEDLVAKAGLANQISFQKGDVSNPPFEKDTFDWAWSSCCVGYAAAIEPLPTLKELARVVKPGGCIAILAWTSENLLPGHPLLEARLAATVSGLAPFTKGKRPELHFMRALGWFTEIGFTEIQAQTFIGNVSASMNDDLYNAMVALFDMRWPGVKSELKKDEWEEYQRLCLPDSPGFILNAPDYYAFFTCTMFWGKVDK